MEKYGVDEKSEQEKEATKDTKQICPVCSAPLRDTQDTGVLLCPNCGSQPFEELD